VAKHFLAGYKRKRFVLAILLPLSIACFILAALIGARESSLPFALQMDELRLLEPADPIVSLDSDERSFFAKMRVKRAARKFWQTCWKRGQLMGDYGLSILGS
jgi:hypothetical protein